MQNLKRLASGALYVFMLGCAAPTQIATPTFSFQEAISNPDRPQTDVDKDGLRKPALLMSFAGVKPGDKILELIPGTGYFTRIFSNIVGSRGHVYALVPSELMKVAPKSADDVNLLVTQPPFSNVSVSITPSASVAAAEPVDVVWTSDNYHDIYGFFGADQALAFDRAVFKALKPGGTFIVIDHVAKENTSDVSPKTLHRIDPATVKAQVVQAGFEFVGESNALYNPDDTHELLVFNPVVRGKTDQFAYRFRKPL